MQFCLFSKKKQKQNINKHVYNFALFLIKLYAVFVTFLKRNQSLQEHVTQEILC